MDNGAGGGILENIGLLIPIIVIIVLGILMRRRGGAKTNLEVAIGLLSDIKHNQKITDSLSSTWQVKKKFKTGNWSRNKDKIDFLDEQLQHEIVDAFSLAEDYNQRIDEAKRQKSTSYLMGIQADKMGDSLTKSREGLEVWVRENFQTELFQRRRRGLFG